MFDFVIRFGDLKFIFFLFEFAIDIEIKLGDFILKFN